MRARTLLGPCPISTDNSAWKSEATVPYYVYDCKKQPCFLQTCQLWMYGNLDLLRMPLAFAPSTFDESMPYERRLDAIEQEAEGIVFLGKVLVCGIHNHWHQRGAVVPLRWGAPRIVVMSGGIRYHLGEDLDQEPFQTARLWRYEWDAGCDLAISRRAPDKLPTHSLNNPTIDHLIRAIANESIEGLPFASRQASFLF